MTAYKIPFVLSLLCFILTLPVIYFLYQVGPLNFTSANSINDRNIEKSQRFVTDNFGVLADTRKDNPLFDVYVVQKVGM
jgi:hypothetical protein